MILLIGYGNGLERCRGWNPYLMRSQEYLSFCFSVPGKSFSNLALRPLSRTLVWNADSWTPPPKILIQELWSVPKNLFLSVPCGSEEGLQGPVSGNNHPSPHHLLIQPITEKGLHCKCNTQSVPNLPLWPAAHYGTYISELCPPVSSIAVLFTYALHIHSVQPVFIGHFL